MRPMYETQADRDKQFEIATLLMSKWNCEMEALPHSYELDFAAIRSGVLVGMVEVKVRNRLFSDFDDVILSLGKWKTLKEYEAIGIPGMLVFKFNDGLYSHRVRDYSGVPQWGGRTTNTRDPADIEPVVKIPNHCWKKIA